MHIKSFVASFHEYPDEDSEIEGQDDIHDLLAHVLEISETNTDSNIKNYDAQDVDQEPFQTSFHSFSNCAVLHIHAHSSSS